MSASIQNYVEIATLATISLYALTFLTALFTLSERLKRFNKIFTYILGAGIVTHMTALILRTIYVGHAPMANLYETLFFFSFTVSVATIAYHLYYKIKWIDLISIPVALTLLIIAHFLDHKFTPLFLALRTIWFEIHVMASFASYALFTISFSAAFFFLIFSKKNKTEAALYEEIVNSANLWGFSLFSFAMFSGAIWAYLAWGNYWLWEPKTIWSFILWLYFAGIIHGHYLKKWRGRRVAFMTIFGFAIVLFTYMGVSLLMKSTHNM